ncbi:MAG: hypothetical protein EXR88_02565 [Gammaproteobacteria bacterium]|nr:hypothetical protein [Gammaproteobacteria bacterium]
MTPHLQQAIRLLQMPTFELEAHIQEARWLIKSLEVRNESLLNVAKAIFMRQSKFLDEGEEKMWPMILKDIDTAIAMH